MEVHLAMVHREKTSLASYLCKLQFFLTIQRKSHNAKNRNDLAPGTKWQVNNVLEFKRPKQNIFFYHISVMCCYGGHCPHCFLHVSIPPHDLLPPRSFQFVFPRHFFFHFVTDSRQTKLAAAWQTKLLCRSQDGDTKTRVCECVGGWMCVCVVKF